MLRVKAGFVFFSAVFGSPAPGISHPVHIRTPPGKRIPAGRRDATNPHDSLRAQLASARRVTLGRQPDAGAVPVLPHAPVAQQDVRGHDQIPHHRGHRDLVVLALFHEIADLIEDRLSSARLSTRASCSNSMSRSRSIATSADASGRMAGNAAPKAASTLASTLSVFAGPPPDSAKSRDWAGGDHEDGEAPVVQRMMERPVHPPRGLHDDPLCPAVREDPGDLADRVRAIPGPDHLSEDARRAEAAGDACQARPLPLLRRLGKDDADQPGGVPTQGEDADTHGIEPCQIGAGGQAAVEHPFRGRLPGSLLPCLDEPQSPGMQWPTRSISRAAKRQ